MKMLAALSTVLNNPAWDSVLVLFFLVAGFILGTMGGGRNKLISFLCATYISLFLSPIIFQWSDSYKKVVPNPYRNFGIYLILLIVLLILFQKTFFASSSRSSAFAWWQALIMSFLVVGLFTAGSLNIVSFRGIVEFSRFTKTFFTGPGAYLFWSIMPLVGLFVVSRGK